MELCNIIIYLQPNCIDAWQNKADSYFCLGKTQESLETYRLALYKLAEGSQSSSSPMNVSPQTIEKEVSNVTESCVESCDDSYLQEKMMIKTQPPESKKRILKAITERIRERAQFLGRLVKNGKIKLD